jgi:hypothetical protein
MTRQVINVGTSPNKGDGDVLRVAFGKINSNFEELYDRDLNTDAQTLTLVGDTLTLSNGGTVDLSKYADAPENLAAIATSGSYNDLSDIPIAQGQHLLYVDKSRTDTYTPNGSYTQPFKSISSALSSASTAGDGASVPYTIAIAEGSYDEVINLNSTGLSAVSLIGVGRVAINPTAGNSLQSITSNSGLQQLLIRNIEFGKPVLITGDGTADQFNNVSLVNVTLGDVCTINTANSVLAWDLFAEGNLTINNVNYFYTSSGQVLGTLTVSYDSNTTVPSSGITPANVLISNTIANGTVFSNAGTGAPIVQTYSSKFGVNGGSYTVPTGMIINANNSVFRGTWTNNGALQLRNSYSDNPIQGNAPSATGYIAGNVRFPDATVQTTAYTGPQTSLTGDVTGSVFADDSTLLVDAVNGSIPYSVLSGAPAIPSGSSIANGTTQIDIPNEDGNINIDGDVVLFGGLEIHRFSGAAGDNDLLFVNSGVEQGRITAQGETGGAIQIQSRSVFEVKVDQGSETALWTFSFNGGVEFPNGGSLRVGTAPATSVGQEGDVAGTVAFDSVYIYYCIADFDNVSDIWKRVELTGGTW